MNGKNDAEDILHQLNIWGPRILIAVSILLFVYFIQRTERFSGLFGESFLAEENLALSRGPLAPKEFYERGEVDYKGTPMFPDETAGIPVDASQIEISGQPADATLESASPQ